MHRHHWIMVSVNNDNYSEWFKTKVLYRCTCGRTKVKRMRGRWTKEELSKEL